MSYYMTGDYYARRGGMYRGDPGFFSFLGSIAKKAVGFIPGVGPAISAGLDLIPKLGGGGAKSAIVKAAESPGAMRRISQGAIDIVKKHPVLSAAGAAGALTAGGMAAHHMLKGGGERKRRRMNPCNARALRRAIRRAHAFEHLAKKVIGFSSPRKPKGRMYFKAKRKR
jgi:hypothetical protein